MGLRHLFFSFIANKFPFNNIFRIFVLFFFLRSFFSWLFEFCEFYCLTVSRCVVLNAKCSSSIQVELIIVYFVMRFIYISVAYVQSFHVQSANHCWFLQEMKEEKKNDIPTHVFTWYIRIPISMFIFMTSLCRKKNFCQHYLGGWLPNKVHTFRNSSLFIYLI